MNNVSIKDYHFPATKDYPFSHAIFSFSTLMDSNAYAVYLASKILNKSTKRYQKPYQLNRYFYQLAGLELDMFVVKWGDRLLLNIELSHFNHAINEQKRFQLYELTKEMLFDGQYCNGLYPPLFFEEERVSHLKEIEMMLNNPVDWHFQLFMEKMFSDDPFRYSLLGSKEQVQHCTNTEVGKMQKDFLEKSQRIPLLYGDFSDKEIAFFQDLADKGKTPAFSSPPLPVRTEPVLYEEEINYQQTWVFLGYRHDIHQNHRLYPALHVYNQILGKLPASILYTRLREKSGLCYNIGSSLPFGKEVLFVIAGITYKDKDVFLKEMEKAFLSLSHLDHKKPYLKLAKNRILSNVQGWQDYPLSRLSFELEIALKKASYTYQSYIQSIAEVTWEQVEEITQHIWLDTIYICKGSQKE